MPSFLADGPATSYSTTLVASQQDGPVSNKAIACARPSAELSNGQSEPTSNGIQAANGVITNGVPKDQFDYAAANGRPSGGSGTYGRDKAIQYDGDGAAAGQVGLDSVRRSSRQSSASTRPTVGEDSVISTSPNGAVVSPFATRTQQNGASVIPAAGSIAPSNNRSDVTNPTTLNRSSVQQTQPSVHRFSSPPVFATPSSAPGATSSTSSQTPKPPPLRHRHTLEVPKPASSRPSRDISSTVHSNNSGDLASNSGWLSYGTGTRRQSLTLGRRTTRSIHSDLHLDELPQDEEAARWTEAIRQKRSSRRRRKEEEDDDRVVMGTKVDQNHVNWVTAYNMLTGIRFTVSRTNAKVDRELTDADFDAKQKFSFDITGNELTPSAKYDFKFKDYAPWVFRHLRAKFKLDPADYLMSLTSKYILSELGSPGKSGSFFYFSRDYKYIIKTIHHGEHKLLRKILRQYYDHVMNNPDTLLSQFYGLHRVKIPYGKKIHFVVMNNIFPPHRDIHQTFDLKGSTIGRDFKEEELAKNPRATLKDLNWLRRGMHLELGPSKREVFLEQVRRDVKLLQRLEIMDYSLLVGIHDLERGNEENLRDKTLQVFQPGGEKNEDPEEGDLLRTPSKMENARKAKELRQIIKKERPIPMDQSSNKMPEEMLEHRKYSIFHADDGGFRATHEDDRPGEVVYYLGIIDCLTHYGVVKKTEHFLKGLSNPKSQISAVAPQDYGERFIRFITGTTMSREEAEREKQRKSQHDGSPEFAQVTRSATDRVMEKAEKQALRAEREGRIESTDYDRTIITVQHPSSGDITIGAASNALPIVDEAGEGGSTSGRSGRSRDESVGNEKQDQTVPVSETLPDSDPGGKGRRPRGWDPLSEKMDGMDGDAVRPFVASPFASAPPPPPPPPPPPASKRMVPEPEDLTVRVARVSS